MTAITSPTDAHAALRRIGDALLEIGHADAIFFIRGLAAWEAGDGVTLDQAFQVKPAPGGKTCHTVERLAARDALLRDIALRPEFSALPSKRRRAAMIGQKLLRYEAGGWLRDRQSPTPPERLAGKIERSFWLILSLGKAPSADTIRGILIGSDA